MRTKELESKLELEQATRARLDVQCNRHKDALEKLQSEIAHVKNKEMHAQESLKKAQKSLRFVTYYFLYYCYLYCNKY